MTTTYAFPAGKTLRFAGFAAYGREIRVFHVYGPTPTFCAYDDVIAVFPNTRKGYKDASQFAFDHGMERDR